MNILIQYGHLMVTVHAVNSAARQTYKCLSVLQQSGVWEDEGLNCCP